MAEFILKDQHGKEKTFDHDRIFVMGTDGELVQFTEGTGDAPAVVQPLEVTENGTYTPPAGVDGYSPVTVSVPEPEITLQDKTITENGTYTADSGYDGLGSVTVVVAGSGGGNLPAGGYWGEFTGIPETFPDQPASKNPNWFELGGEVYAFLGNQTATSSGIWAKYKLVNGSWEKIADTTYIDCDRFAIKPVELNGKLHFLPKYGSYHWTFDGITAVKLANFPVTMDYSDQVFLQDGKLKCYAKNTVYVWDEATDTWSTEATLSFVNYLIGIFMVDGTVYMSADSKMYIYKNGTVTQYATLTETIWCNVGVVVNGKLYYSASSNTGMVLKCYDFAAKTNSYVSKIPGYDNHRHLKSWKNNLLVLPDEEYTYASVFQFYEVTE